MKEKTKRNRKIPCYIGYRSTLEDIEKKTDKSVETVKLEKRRLRSFSKGTNTNITTRTKIYTSLNTTGKYLINHVRKEM